jgi:hypothetical protein
VGGAEAVVVSEEVQREDASEQEASGDEEEVRDAFVCPPPAAVLLRGDGEEGEEGGKGGEGHMVAGGKQEEGQSEGSMSEEEGSGSDGVGGEATPIVGGADFAVSFEEWVEALGRGGAYMQVTNCHSEVWVPGCRVSVTAIARVGL